MLRSIPFDLCSGLRWLATRPGLVLAQAKGDPYITVRTINHNKTPIHANVSRMPTALTAFGQYRIGWNIRVASISVRPLPLQLTQHSTNTNHIARSWLTASRRRGREQAGLARREPKIRTYRRTKVVGTTNL